MQLAVKFIPMFRTDAANSFLSEVFHINCVVTYSDIWGKKIIVSLLLNFYDSKYVWCPKIIVIKL